MDRIKTYIINLTKDQERRESVLNETGQYPCLEVEMVRAVYGKELTDEEKGCLFNTGDYARRYRRSVLPGEIGCVLSHRACYKRMLESDQEFALILEDDARFVEGVFTEDFSESVMDFMKDDKPLVLLLHADFESIGKKSPFYGNFYLYPVYSALFATAYLINKKAANLLLQEKFPYWVADDWLLFRRWGIRVYSLYPSVVIQQWDTFGSSILDEKRSSGRKRILPRSLIECRMAYEKLGYYFLRTIGIIRHLHG